MSGGWTVSGNQATQTIASLAKGATATLTITFMVDIDFQATSINNCAEISGASNVLGQPDVDSTPDQNDMNDVAGEDDFDCEPITIDQTFDLTLDKTLLSAGPFVPGSTVSYTISVTNEGTLDATNIEVTDYIPAGLNYVSGGWTVSGNQATQTIASLAKGATATLTITFMVDIDFQATSINNCAEISGANNVLGQPDVDSTPDQNDMNDVAGEDDFDCAPVTIDQTFDLALTKSLNNSTVLPIYPGGTVTFDIEVTNQGTLDATDIEITDYIPAEFILADGNWSQSGNLATTTIASLGYGQSTTVTITFTIDTDYQGGDIVNFAEISGATNVLGQPDIDSTPDQDNTNDAGGQPNSAADDYIDGDGTGAIGSGNAATDEDDHDPALISIDPLIDLELEKSVSDLTPTVGDVITFTVAVTNQGPSVATNVSIQDNLPDGYSNVQNITGGGQNFSNILLWSNLTIGVGQTLTFTYNVTVEAEGGYQNCAEVVIANETDIDSTPNNGVDTDGDGETIDDDGDEDDGDCEEVDPEPLIDLELEKTVNNSTPDVGTNVVFTLTVINQGPSTATGVIVNDQIPSGYDYQSSNGNYNPATGDWTIGTLGAGQSVSLNIVAEVLASGEYENCAEVTNANENDIDSTPDNGVFVDEDDDDCEVVEPNPIIDLELEKSANVVAAFPGDEIVFTIEVVNNGPSDATDVVVNDFLESGFTYVSHIGGDYDPATGAWNIGDLDAGASVVLDISVEINGTGEYGNCAEVIAATQDDLDSTPNNGVDTDGDGQSIDDSGDEDDGDCEEIIVYCDVDVTILSVDCEINDPLDPNDDSYTFTMTVSGSGIGTSEGWTHNIPYLAAGVYPYDTEITVSVPSVDIDINSLAWDVDNGSCRDGVEVEAPGPEDCIGDCVFQAILTQNFACNDNGTPGDPSDDYYTFQVTATSVFGNAWTATLNGESLGNTSPYGYWFTTPGFAPGTTVEVYIEDVEDPDCNGTVTVTLPEETCSEDCAMLTQVGEVVCDPNGTLSDASDDLFVFTVDIIGNNTSGVWEDTYGNTGTVPGSFTYSFPIAEGPVSITIYDANSANIFECDISTFTVNPPAETCSDACEVSVALAGEPVCDDNGTPADPADDQYFFTLNVTDVNNAGAAWTATLVDGTVIGTGIYGTDVEFGPYNIGNGNPVTVFVTADNDEECMDQITITPPQDCSPECAISVVQTTTPGCNDNGTAADPTDDFWSFEVEVAGNNTSGGWTATDQLGNTYSSAYGQSTIIGNFDALVTSITLNIQDAEDANCTTTITIAAPEMPCSEECAIEIVVVDVYCDDQGTPYNGNDDQYFAIIYVTGFNTSGQWVVAGSNTTYNYGPNGTAILPMGNANTDVPVAISVHDADDPSCEASTFVTSPGPCDECGIEIVLGETVCDDNGTATEADDTYTVEVTVVCLNNCSAFGWTQVGVAQGLSGQYGEVVTFGPYSVFEEPTIKVADQTTFLSCRAEVDVVSPGPCSEGEDCEIFTEVVNITCDNNGTNSDPTDDFTVFTVNISGNGTGNCWTADNGDSGVYGQTVFTFPADGQVHTVVITDCEDQQCQTILQLQSTLPCSNGGDCEIAAVILEKHCELNDMEDPSDDSTVFTIMVTSTSETVCWTDGIGGSGSFTAGVIQIFEYESNGAIINFEFFACDDETCSTTLEAQTFVEPCNICQTGVDLVNVWCDDQGTTNDQTDDVFYFTLFIVDSLGNQGPTWHTEGLPEEYTGNYSFDNPVTFGPFLISDGPANFDIVSDLTDDCPIVVFITPPLTCSCGLEANIEEVDCNFDGTFNVTLTIDNGPSNGWFAEVNGESVGFGFYPATETFGPFTGETTIEFYDFGDDNCNESLTIDPTEYCGECNLVPVISNVTCQDNGTPGNPDDDFYTFDISVTGGSGTGWTSTIGSGVYGVTYTFTSENGENTNFNLYDNENPNCGVSVFVQSPTPCLPDCDITATVLSVECNDNGTPEQAEDDYYAATVLVTGDYYGPDNTWVATWDGGQATGTYGEPVEIGPFTSETIVTITDSNFADCSDEVTILLPELVVECPLNTHFCPIIEEDIMLFTTDPWVCTGTVEVPMPNVSGSTCAPDLSWTVITEIWTLDESELIAVLLPGDDRILYEMPVGDYIVRYNVTDFFGMTTTLDCYFRVMDLDNPVAVCDDGMNISLGGFGLARVYTFMVDNGSYDNCGIDSILVRREYTRDPMTCDTIVDPTWSDWGEFVEFNCCDAGLYVTVQMRVVDIYGNENICWTEVLVEDNTLPLCYGLEDVSVSCDELPIEFDAYDLGHLASVFGMPVVVDNCSAETVEFEPIVNLSDCGEGTIIRRFQAVDAVGNYSMDIFEQIVTIIGGIRYEVKLPQDTETDCIDNAYTVELYHTGCDSIVVTHEDVFLPVEGEECYNVLRTYHIINYCEWDGIADPVNISRDEDCDGVEGEEPVWIIRTTDTTFVDRDSLYFNMMPVAGTKGTDCDGESNPEGYWRITASTGYWTYTQHLIIRDTIAPVVLFDIPEAFCTDTADCETMVYYPFTVSENCIADNIDMRILLDAGADGTIDLDLTGSGILQGSYPDFMLVGSYPIGSHEFEVVVDDGCGNITTVQMPFEVVDCYIPEMDCYSGLMVELEAVEPGVDVNGDGEADDGYAVVYAYQLASCQVEDCSAPLSFSVNRIGDMPHPDSTSVIVTCDDRYSIQLEVYMWDTAFNPYSVQPDGTIGGPNYDNCEVTVFVQDPLEVCPDCSEFADLQGRIATIQNKPIEGAMVTLTNAATDSFMDEVETDEEGIYEFEDVALGGDYTITPELDVDYLNGVTTMDLILIQQHLLGGNPLASPYLLLAADVNNSGSITALDLIEIKKLILGQISEFTSVDSWIFIDAAYEFTDETNPWAEGYPQTITLHDLDGCKSDLDFIGIKMGDVNMTADPSIYGSVESRNENGQFRFGVKDQAVEPGQEYTITFTAPELALIKGYQFTLNFDTKVLDFVDVAAGIALDDNFGFDFIGEGLITTSWYISDGNSIFVDKDDNPEMFKLTFRAKDYASSLSKLLTTSSDFTPMEAYGVDGSILGVGIQFNISADQLTETGYVFELYQNTPNPFGQTTNIGFELPYAAETTLMIRDVSGREISRISGSYEKGYNEMTLERGSLSSGVYYYTLTTGEFTATRKMIVNE